MFFKKKKPKLDAKVRFQHKQFTTKLGSARSYRRTAVAVPESQWQRWLASIGLGSKWSQILVGLFIATIIYLVYIPNFLTIKEIKISGLSESQTHDLDGRIRDQIAEAGFYKAQNNLFFFDSDLAKTAAAKLASVNSILQVKKDYKNHSLIIVAESKYEKYLVATPEKVFDIYNDGTFKAEAGIARDTWLNIDNPNMIKVELYQNANSQNGQQFFDSNLQQFISALNDRLKAMENFKVAYYSFHDPKVDRVVTHQDIAEKVEAAEKPATSASAGLDTRDVEQAAAADTQPIVTEETPELKLPFNSSEVNVVFYKGSDKKRFFKVIFDATRDSQKTVENLKLLLAQTAPDRFNQLDYIDMRIDAKAFICLLNAPCAR